MVRVLIIAIIEAEARLPSSRAASQLEGHYDPLCFSIHIRKVGTISAPSRVYIECSAQSWPKQILRKCFFLIRWYASGPVLSFLTNTTERVAISNIMEGTVNMAKGEGIPQGHVAGKWLSQDSSSVLLPKFSYTFRFCVRVPSRRSLKTCVFF